MPYSQNILRAEIFNELANFSLNKNFCDLIFEVMHLDISIIMFTIIIIASSIDCNVAAR